MPTTVFFGCMYRAPGLRLLLFYEGPTGGPQSVGAPYAEAAGELPSVAALAPAAVAAAALAAAAAAAVADGGLRCRATPLWQ